MSRQALDAGELESLLGIEGMAAHSYFGHFVGMIKVESGETVPAFDFTRPTGVRRGTR